MIFEVEGGDETNEGLTDRTHTRIVSFIVLDMCRGEYLWLENQDDLRNLLMVTIYILIK